ncbi:zinc ribbon domain-containing protein [Priestia megaterium]
MPIYRFNCTKCNESFETIVQMGTEETACKCGAVAKKDYAGSMMFSSTGLPNGHNSIRSKIRGK